MTSANAARSEAPLTSDDPPEPNPFKAIKPNSGDFYARVARVKWSDALGRNSLTLTTNDYKDKRHITVHDGDPLYNAIVKADPYLPDFPTNKERALYPVWKLCLDNMQRVVSFEVMPISRDEQIRADVQRRHDELHALGKALALGWGTVDHIIRDCQQLHGPDWLEPCKEQMRTYAASKQSEKAIGYIAFRKNEWDYWWKHDTNTYPFDTQTASTLEAWFGPKEKPVSDQSAVKTLGDHFKDDKVRKSFWQSAHNLCKANGLDAKLHDEHIHEVLGVESAIDFEGTPGEALNLIKGSFDTKTKRPEPPAETSTEVPVLGDSSEPAPTTPTKRNTQQEGDKPHMENDKAIEIDKAEFRKQRTIKIQGRDYLKAGDRIVMFRSDHPDWALETEAVQLLPDFAVFKAFIKDGSGKLLATAHGFCTPDLAQKVSGRFVEKAETAAIARALAFVGYGTDDTLDDSDYLSDSPIERKAA